MAEIEDHSEDPNWAPKQDMSLLCRVCANQHDYLIPIFEGEGLDHDMPNKMEKHLPIKVRENDKLPTQMCYQCASTIIAWSDLHTNCLEANKKLNHMLKINEKKFVEMGPEDEDAASDHYEDTYEAPSGGGDEDDEDFEKEIKQLISDAGVELDSSSSGTSKFRKILPKPTSKQVASKTPSKPAKVSRKRKSETSTPVKKESKKSKSDVGASSSGTVALLKPKEENVNSDDRCMIWSCCKCICKYSSWSQLSDHMFSHASSSTSNTAPNIKQEISSVQPICVNCERSYDSHMTMHKPESLYHCAHCPEVFVERKIIDMHMKVVHSEDMSNWFVCKICRTKMFQRSNRMRRHIEDEHDQYHFERDYFMVSSIQDMTFPCKVCGQACFLSATCNKHKASKIQDYSNITNIKSSDTRMECNEHPQCHSCQKCDESFYDCETLWSHMLLNHEDADLTCNLCPALAKGIIKHPYTLLKHMGRYHAINLEIPSVFVHIMAKSQVMVNGKVCFKCIQCCITVKNFELLKTHMKTHSTESDYVCFVCNKLLSRTNVLMEHVRSVHLKIRNFSCPDCPRTFSTVYNLREHVNIHTALKKHVCEICGQAFVHKGSLNMHRYSHGTPFMCNICGKNYSNPMSYKRHILENHSNNPSYVCDICGKELKTDRSLRFHMAVHSNDRPFVCPICNSAFKLKKTLRQHHRMRHMLKK